MPRITFPQVLQRHVRCPPLVVAGSTVREVFEAAFAVHPTLRSYLLDDSGALRTHVTVFVDGEVVRDRARLLHAVGAASEIDVLQALSGG
jgi:molybdopterin synthase sulfur carrier subunit